MCLIQTGRIHPEKLITHKFHGLENVEPALMLMKDKPADLIKPLVLLWCLLKKYERQKEAYACYKGLIVVMRAVLAVYFAYALRIAIASVNKLPLRNTCRSKPNLRFLIRQNLKSKAGPALAVPPLTLRSDRTNNQFVSLLKSASNSVQSFIMLLGTATVIRR